MDALYSPMPTAVMLRGLAEVSLTSGTEIHTSRRKNETVLAEAHSTPMLTD